MTAFQRLIAALAVMVIGNVAFAQDAIVDDKNLSPNQKKYLKQLKKDLEDRPINPTASVAYVSKVQGTLKQLFAINNKPSDECTNTLAASLYNGLNNGQVSIETTLLLSKEISKALGAQQISFQNVNQFTRAIDPLVQQTKLGPTEKLRLYREALIILKTVPNYSPESR